MARNELVQRLAGLYAHDRPEAAGAHVNLLIDLGIITETQGRDILVDALVASTKLRLHARSTA
ncbi:MAG: hypothetical protein JO212_09510 [Acetobacteraceae bacterium]|nr:hypothetical protein [Acetobacteraceae bacterium]